MKVIFSKSKKKQFIAFVLCVTFLFLITSQNTKNKINNRVTKVSEINTINYKKVSPKDLFLSSWATIKSNYYKRDLNSQNWLRWKKRYQHVIKTQEDANVAINSMLLSLDDSYSKFMNEQEFSLQNSAINSKLYGIGINIASIAGKIYIVNVLDGAPAQVSGILAGDIILKINNEDVSGQSIYHVAQLIRGNVNENIELELLRGNDKFIKNLKRAEIKIKTIDSKKITDDIGYIRVSSFIGADTVKDFIIAINRLSKTKGLIIDLRGNSGGLFQNAIAISNLFLEHGVIVNVIARQGKKNTYSAKDDGCIYNSPVVVLIDESSASASEIFASALKDNNRATLIGTKTFGKGLVQKVFPLPNQTGMNLTIARYITPKGVDINKKGIIPDYYVVFSRNDFLNNIDPQLNFAKQYLEKRI